MALSAASSRWLSALALPPAVASRCCRIVPRGASPAERQPLTHRFPPQHPGQQQLCHGAPASNKPHPAEKSTPVWLAIWRTWARFANSQHRDAAFTTPNNVCAHSFLLPHWAAAQTDANLSAHLHRLPTPPPYLRRMRLSPSLVRRSCKSPSTLGAATRTSGKG